MTLPLVDHLGISVADVAATADRFEPVLTELGYVRADAGTTVFWTRLARSARQLTGGWR
ncbi:hypothetical protein [Microbacterium schleiferi]|uniref:Uncharacterized protein n=1 Tax=Microbacterium schleiferi TaxID=69362 RepID=A0ABU7V7J7_9MICO